MDGLQWTAQQWSAGQLAMDGLVMDGLAVDQCMARNILLHSSCKYFKTDWVNGDGRKWTNCSEA